MTKLTYAPSRRQMLANIKQRVLHAQMRAVTRALPQTLQSSLPRIEDIEEELKGGEA